MQGRGEPDQAAEVFVEPKLRGDQGAAAAGSLAMQRVCPVVGPKRLLEIESEPGGQRGQMQETRREGVPGRR